MFHRILVPYDDSQPARAACAVAIRLAASAGGKVRLVHHFDPMEFPNALGYGEPVIRSAEAAARNLVDDAKARLQGAGVEVDAQLCLKPGRRLGASVAEAAGSWQADLVVLGSHGRKGIAHMLLGSGAEQIVRESRIPALVVRGDEAPESFRRILVAVDGSETSTHALVTALQLARDSGASVRLFHSVGEIAYLGMEQYAGGGWLQEAEANGTRVLAKAADIAASAGVPAETFLSLSDLSLGGGVAGDAEGWKADLLVVGTHGRRGVRRALLGSGAEQIVRESPVPVLVVPPAT